MNVLKIHNRLRQSSFIQVERTGPEYGVALSIHIDKLLKASQLVRVSVWKWKNDLKSNAGVSELFPFHICMLLCFINHLCFQFNSEALPRHCKCCYVCLSHLKSVFSDFSVTFLKLPGTAPQNMQSPY